MHSPFRPMAIVVLMLLTLSMAACSRLPEQAVQQSVQPNESANNLSTPYPIDLNKIREERQRLEKTLADYEKHLDQIWQHVGTGAF